jgi:hypothetical protein
MKVQAGCVLANQEKEAYRTTMERMLEVRSTPDNTIPPLSAVKVVVGWQRGFCVCI